MKSGRKEAMISPLIPLPVRSRQQERRLWAAFLPYGLRLCRHEKNPLERMRIRGYDELR
jgi:hypothetical protein